MEMVDYKRRKYIGVGGDDVPSLGVLEGDILRLLWDAGAPQSSVQVYEAMHFSRRLENREMQSPSTIAVTLSRMVEKGHLTVERKPKGGKGFYSPTQRRSDVVISVMDDVCRRLTGESLAGLLDPTPGADPAASKEDPSSAYSRLIGRLRDLTIQNRLE